MDESKRAGGLARAAKLPPDRRRLIASAAARARWGDRSIPDDKTHIYVIGADAGPMKVGIANSPINRRSALQVGSHVDLSIHHATLVDKNLSRQIEAYAHWLLGETSKGGEWFDCSAIEAEEAVSVAISAVARGERAPRRPPAPRGVREVRRLIFDLTDEERAALERVRIRFGLRSHAETLRRLIREADGGQAAEAPPTPKPSFSHGRSKTVVAATPKRRAAATFKPRVDTYPDWMKPKPKVKP